MACELAYQQGRSYLKNSIRDSRLTQRLVFAIVCNQEEALAAKGRELEELKKKLRVHSMRTYLRKNRRYVHKYYINVAIAMGLIKKLTRIIMVTCKGGGELFSDALNKPYNSIRFMS